MGKKVTRKIILMPRGFTLVELLVVISIIGFLSSTIITSINTARDKGNNAYKVRMVEEYMKAFELARDDLGGYPWDSGTNVNISVCLGTTSCDDPSAPSPLMPNSVINNTFTPYITIQPAFKSYIYNDPVFGPSSLRGGPAYNCTQLVNGKPNLCARANIYYTLTQRSRCGLGAAEINYPYGGFVGCTLFFQ